MSPALEKLIDGVAFVRVSAVLTYVGASESNVIVFALKKAEKEEFKPISSHFDDMRFLFCFAEGWFSPTFSLIK